MSNRPVHFEIYAEDPERAVKFYEKAFGWKFQKFAPVDYWLITTGAEGTPGINGGLGVRKGKVDAKATAENTAGYIVVIDVADIDKGIKTVKAAGVTPTVPKQPIPGIGWSAYFKDTEGNHFGLYQRDEKAK
jgi:predicted enzyme related to lactoylglutathione lyase